VEIKSQHKNNNMTTELSTQPEVTDIQIQRENAAFEMLQRQAKMFSSSSLVPKDFQGNIANCAIGINIAKRLGADPFMVLQNIDIIHGRPSFRATFLIAMVNAAGRFEPLQFRMEGDEGKPSRSCVAWTKSKPDGTPLEGPKITLEMAKAEGWSTKNGSKWLTMPELMLRYRAAAFFARLYAPDITLGMMTADEAVDIQQERDVTPAIIPATKALFEVKQEPKAIDANRTPWERLKDAMEANGLHWGQVANAANEGGLFVDIETQLIDQPEDVVLEIMSVWPQLVASVKGGAK
jgi:hypothetical protein